MTQMNQLKQGIGFSMGWGCIGGPLIDYRKQQVKERMEWFG